MRVIIDLDFGAILAATRGEKPSVVQIRAENVSPESIGTAVLQTMDAMVSPALKFLT